MKLVIICQIIYSNVLSKISGGIGVLHRWLLLKHCLNLVFGTILTFGWGNSPGSPPTGCRVWDKHIFGRAGIGLWVRVNIGFGHLLMWPPPGLPITPSNQSKASVRDPYQALWSKDSGLTLWQRFLVAKMPRYEDSVIFVWTTTDRHADQSLYPLHMRTG